MAGIKKRADNANNMMIGGICNQIRCKDSNIIRSLFPSSSSCSPTYSVEYKSLTHRELRIFACSILAGHLLATSYLSATSIQRSRLRAKSVQNTTPANSFLSPAPPGRKVEKTVVIQIKILSFVKETATVRAQEQRAKDAKSFRRLYASDYNSMLIS